MLFAELAAATEDVRAESGARTRSRGSRPPCAGSTPAERAAGAGYLAGAPRQRVLGVGWASLQELPPPAASPSLTVAEVDAAFAALAALSGAGLAGARGGRR